jgi:hypothetical protein
MNKKLVTKILLDITMLVLFITLINAKGTSLSYHEIVGLGIFGLFSAHIALNWVWVKNITKNLFNPKIKSKIKWMYVLNTTLFLSIIIILLTGIAISEVIFGLGSSESPEILYTVHKVASYFCLAIFNIHITLHWKYLMSSLKMIFFNPNGNKAVIAIKRIGATAMIFFIIYKIAFPNSNNSEAETALANSNSSYKSSTKSTLQDSQTSSSNAITLDDYLNNLFCTACHKQCPLTNPRCGKGNRQAQNATLKYQNLYGKSGQTSQSNTNTATPSDSQQNSQISGSDTTDKSTDLSNLFCTSCHKQCPLSNPECRKGERQAQQALMGYKQSYGKSYNMEHKDYEEENDD